MTTPIWKLTFFNTEWESLVGPRFGWAHKKEISIVKQKIFQTFLLHGEHSQEAIIESGLITLFISNCEIMRDVTQDMVLIFIKNPEQFITNNIRIAKSLFELKLEGFVRDVFKRDKLVKIKHYFRAIVFMLVDNELEDNNTQNGEIEFGIYS